MTPTPATPRQHPRLDRPRPVRAPPPQARRGPVGPRLPGAAERERAVQEGRQPAQRAGAHQNIYSQRGFDSIDPADLRGRFRWWGLYTQRKPGLDGGKTARPGAPGARRRATSCCASAPTARCSAPRSCAPSASISRDFGRDTADITDRQNIQYHWIRHRGRAGDLGSASRRSAWSTQEACGDSPRGVPRLAGRRRRQRRDHRRHPGARGDQAPLHRRPGVLQPAAQVQDRADRATRATTCAPEVNDVSFVGTVHPEHGPGFDLWVGGGLSTNPMLAQKLGVWIPLDEVPDVWEGVISVFRDYGYRRLRSRARLKFLVADWGVEKFREVLENEYLDRTLVDCDSPAGPDASAATTSACTSRRTAASTSGSRRPSAGSPAHADRGSATCVEAYGAARRPAHGVPEARRARRRRGPGRRRCVAALERIGLSARPSNWRRSTMACTGIEFCKLAIVDTKQRAADLVAELERRFPDLDTPITVNVNGCPNSCARTQVADIGLKGQLVLDDDGNQVEGFQVHLGGGLGLTRASAGSCAPTRSPAPASTTTSPASCTAYLAERDDGERFAAWVAAPTTSRCAASAAAWRLESCHERARRPVPLPLLRRREPAPARGVATAPGSAAPACAPSRSRCSACSRSPPGRGAPMTTATTAAARAFRGTQNRGPLRRGAARARLARRRRARARAGRGHHRVGRGDLRRPVLRHLLDGRRGARPPGLAGGARASTWCSSTPATTSSRRSAPATRSRRRCRST